MGDFDRCRHTVDQNGLMAPVELIGLAWIEAERNIGPRCGDLGCSLPLRGIPPDGVIATVITKVPQILVDPNRRQALSLWAHGVLSQHRVQL